MAYLPFMALGDPPNYSTRRTLTLALVSLLGAMTHFTLGALEYQRAGPFVGLGQIILASFMLVFGVLTTIRFVEALDAMGDTRPRTPMYDTPHQWWTYRIGAGLHLLGAALCLYWLLRSELPAWYGLALLINAAGTVLALRMRPRPDHGHLP